MSQTFQTVISQKWREKGFSFHSSGFIIGAYFLFHTYMKLNEDEVFKICHEVTVTKENVSDLLHMEIYRLMHSYGPHIADYLYALALGPNAYKCFEVWGKENCSFSCTRTDVLRFCNIPIVCGPLPFVVPIFNENGWHFAHAEAKRILDRVGGLDG